MFVPREELARLPVSVAHGTLGNLSLNFNQINQSKSLSTLIICNLQANWGHKFFM